MEEIRRKDFVTGRRCIEESVDSCTCVIPRKYLDENLAKMVCDV
jgi:hypothetical protein